MDYDLKVQLNRIERNQTLILEALNFNIEDLGYESLIEKEKKNERKFEINEKTT